MAKVEDVAKSLLTEILGPSPAGPVSGEGRSDTADRLPPEDTDAREAGAPVPPMPVEPTMPVEPMDETDTRDPKPRRPDPQEVQYPGYFKEGGSL